MEVPRIFRRLWSISVWAKRWTIPRRLDAATTDMTTITGQKPIQTKARKSIANFKLREGVIIGSKGDSAWATACGPSSTV